MNLRYAITASSAEFTPQDGRVWVLGGDFDSIGTDQFPVTVPMLTLVVKLVFQPAECGVPHTLRVELFDMDANRITEPFVQTFTPGRNERAPGRETGAGFVLTIANVPFERPGDYTFRVLVDDHEYGNVPLYVVNNPINEVSQ